MRLDRYVSNATGISRRLVHREIKAGAVEVDGEPVKSFAFQVGDEQRVLLRGEPIIEAQHLYLMLHKPTGSVCANHDNENPTVIDLLDGAPETCHPTEALQIVGRLDIDTTGLVLLTTDGQWNHKITAPSSQCSKSYFVELADPIDEQTLSTLEAGITLKSEKKPTLPCQITRVSESSVKIELHEGKYHQVKRMFSAVGNRVISLHRERIGNITLPSDLEPGEFRALTDAEIALP